MTKWIIKMVISLQDTEVSENADLIKGCGLALLLPEVTDLFNLCGLLTEGRFANNEARLRAVALLHYVVYGSANSVMTNQLVIANMLCNAELRSGELPLPKLTQKERSYADAMLLKICDNCSRLRNATVDVIRENFIQRNGKLINDGSNLKIAIKKRAHDVLLGNYLDQHRTATLPWLNKEVILNWGYSS